MTNRTCPICSAEVIGQKSKVFCSAPCKDKGKKFISGLTCCMCAGSMVKGKDSKPQGEAAHGKCRSSYVGVRTHGEAGYSTHGCRCDICSAAKAEASRKFHAKVKARDGISYTMRKRREAKGVDPMASWDCAVCKLPLEKASRGGRRPMHKACKQDAPDWFVRGRDNPKVVRLRALADKAAAGTSGKRVFASGHCPWCGDYFMRANAKWCSSKCKTAARFAAKSSTAFRISPIDRLSVYERDGWDCQLCGFPVDRALHYLDDWSATLDHIIPQSHQLVPDHSPKALRLAHRWCNSARGDGSNMTEGEFLARVSVRYQESLAA